MKPAVRVLVVEPVPMYSSILEERGIASFSVIPQRAKQLALDVCPSLVLIRVGVELDQAAVLARELRAVTPHLHILAIAAEPVIASDMKTEPKLFDSILFEPIPLAIFDDVLRLFLVS